MGMNEQNEDVVVRLARKKPLIHTLYALALIVMGCLILFSRDKELQPFVGALMALAGVGLGIRAYLALSDAKPKVIMDAEGIHLPAASLGTLFWGEISSAYIEVIRSTTYLHLVLRDPRRSAELHPELRDRVHNGEIEFNVTGLDMSGEAMTDAIIRAAAGDSPSLHVAA